MVWSTRHQPANDSHRRSTQAWSRAGERRAVASARGVQGRLWSVGSKAVAARATANHVVDDAGGVDRSRGKFSVGRPRLVHRVASGPLGNERRAMALQHGARGKE
jgi:hypothetical protein